MLQIDWVERIFERLTVRYGAAFLNKWLGIDLAVVQADWAHELDGFSNHPTAISYALSNLPERPPNVIEFRAIALRAPVADVPRLDHTRAEPGRIAAEIEKLKLRLPRKSGVNSDKKWAHDMVAKATAGGYASTSDLPLRMAREVVAKDHS